MKGLNPVIIYVALLSLLLLAAFVLSLLPYVFAAATSYH